MMYISQLSAAAGVSVRTLRYYDSIGLLKPVEQSEAGYRLYGEDALDRLRRIALLKELGFSLTEIGRLLEGGAEAWNAAMDECVGRMEAQMRRLENRITLAKGLRMMGVNGIAEGLPDVRGLDEQMHRAQQAMQALPPMPSGLEQRLTEMLGEFAPLRELPPDAEPVRRQVARLRAAYEEWQPFTPRMLQGLGQMIAGGGGLGQMLDDAYGAGTAAFIGEALRWSGR
ncbi:MAG: MerR family transcriptional regulator [Clostridia bacterium]|nr:MerR family transcriptional regulator [Clostridia bacterium]